MIHVTDSSVSVMPASRRYRYDVGVVTWDREAIMSFSEKDEQKVRFTEVRGMVPALKEASTMEPNLPPGMRLSSRRGRGGGRGGSRDSGMGSERGLSTPVSLAGSSASATAEPRSRRKDSEKINVVSPQPAVSQAAGDDSGAKKKRNRKKKNGSSNDASDSRGGGLPKAPSVSAQITIDGVTNDCAKDDDEKSDDVNRSSFAPLVIFFDPSDEDEGATSKERQDPDSESSDAVSDVDCLVRDYYAGKYSVFPSVLDGLTKDKDPIYRFAKKRAVPRSMILADFQLSTGMLFPYSFIVNPGTTPTGEEVMSLADPLQDSLCSRLLKLGPPCDGVIIGIRSQC